MKKRKNLYKSVILEDGPKGAFSRVVKSVTGSLSDCTLLLISNQCELNCNEEWFQNDIQKLSELIAPNQSNHYSNDKKIMEILTEVSIANVGYNLGFAE